VSRDRKLWLLLALAALLAGLIVLTRQLVEAAAAEGRALQPASRNRFAHKLPPRRWLERAFPDNKASA
jgi:hypothetical protein